MTDIGPANLAGRAALVSGGSNGIGAATVRMLAAAGVKVMIGYNSGVERARRLMGELPGEGHVVRRIELDDSASTAALGEAARQAFGRLDVVVNCAGFTRPIPHADLDALDDAFFDRMLIANVRGPFSIIRACAPLLKASPDAIVVNVSSVSAFTGSGSNVAYCASKAGVDSITMSLGRVLGPNVRVMSVSPGAVATDFVAGRDRAALEKMAQNSPLKRVTEPEDVALAVMACITHLRATTGSRIIVDNGRFLL